MIDSDFGAEHYGEITTEELRQYQWAPNITRYKPCLLKLRFDGGFLERKYFEEYNNRFIKESILDNPRIEFVYRIQTRTFNRRMSQLHSYFYIGFPKDDCEDIIIKTQVLEDPSDNCRIDYFMPVTMALHQNDIIRLFQSVIDQRYNISNSIPSVCTCGECDPEYFPRCVLANLVFETDFVFPDDSSVV